MQVCMLACFSASVRVRTITVPSLSFPCLQNPQASQEITLPVATKVTWSYLDALLLEKTHENGKQQRCQRSVAARARWVYWTRFTLKSVHQYSKPMLHGTVLQYCFPLSSELWRSDDGSSGAYPERGVYTAVVSSRPVGRACISCR